MSFLHGVETIEVNDGPLSVQSVRSAVIGLVGTAPAGPVNAMTLITSKAEAAQFGRQNPGYTIPQALDAIYANGSGFVLVVNVAADTEAGPTSLDVTDRRLVIPRWTNPAGTTFTDDQTELTEGEDYRVTNFNVVEIINDDIADGTTITIAGALVHEEAVAADIVGEYDPEDDSYTGMASFATAFNRFGFNPRIFIAPTFSELSAVATALISAANDYRGHCLIDAPIGTTVQEAIEGRGPAGDIEFDTGDERAILCYPHVTRYSPATDSDVLAPYSQSLAGVMAATHANFGFWFSPSNKEIRGISGVELDITFQLNEASTQANALNGAGICTVVSSFGTGLLAWGNRSAAFPGSTAPTNFISVRTVADIINISLEQAKLPFIDQPINQGVIDAIVETGNGYLRTLIARGAIIDGNVSFDQSKNPPTQIAGGQLVFDVEFMPPPPLERVTYESFINIQLLDQLA